MTALFDGVTVNPEDRDQWLARRRLGIGASEAAAVLGICPYQTPRELYLRKLGLLPDRPETEAMRRGLALERYFADEYRRRFPLISMREQQFRVHPEHPFLFATLDGLRHDGIIVEFKSANRRASAGWGEEGSDEIPESYLCQVHHQMLVSGASVCHVLASLGGDDTTLYVVHRAEWLIEKLIRASREFWRRVLDRDPPPVTRPGDASLHHLIFPELAGTVDLDAEVADLVAAWLDAKATKAEAEEVAGRLKAEVLAKLGSAEAGLLADGRVVTARVVTRSAYTCSVSETTFTDLRIKKARATSGK